jgi:chlorophyllide a reductase subunit Y
VVNAALGNKARFDGMKAFFEGVGTGHAAGVWEEVPEDRPAFRKKMAARNKAGNADHKPVGS